MGENKYKMRKYNSLIIPYIPYNKKLVSRAKELRKETTRAEKVFWDKILKDKKLADFKFTKQKPLDEFIVDFFCSSLGVIIEIDGEVHNYQKTRDMERDTILKQKFGLEIIRYTNEEVLKNTNKILEDLIEKIRYINTTPP
jgi:very-short-patch-repair endonuclease